MVKLLINDSTRSCKCEWRGGTSVLPQAVTMVVLPAGPLWLCDLEKAAKPSQQGLPGTHVTDHLGVFLPWAPVLGFLVL